MRAWITSMSSSLSSQIASQYSSKAGWYSLGRGPGTTPSVRQGAARRGRRGVPRCEPGVAQAVGTLPGGRPTGSPLARSPSRCSLVPCRLPGAHCRAGRGLGARSPAVSTRCCARPPGPARPWRPSSGRSTGSVARAPPGPTGAAGSPRRPRLPLAPEGAGGRRREEPARAVAAASRWPPSASGAPSSSPPSGCAPATPRQRSGERWSATTRHPHHHARVAVPDAHLQAREHAARGPAASSSTRSTPSPRPSGVHTWP